MNNQLAMEQSLAESERETCAAFEEHRGVVEAQVRSEIESSSESPASKAMKRLQI